MVHQVKIMVFSSSKKIESKNIKKREKIMWLTLQRRTFLVHSGCFLIFTSNKIVRNLGQVNKIRRLYSDYDVFVEKIFVNNNSAFINIGKFHSIYT